MSYPDNKQDRYDDEEHGGKFYLHPFRVNPHTGDHRFISVTTVTDSFSKDALKIWAAKGSSRLAMEQLPRLIRASRIDPCGDTYKKDGSACQMCSECAVHWLSCWHLKESRRRADEGSEFHDVVEWWSLHGEWKQTRKEVQPYVDRFKEYIADYGLAPDNWELCETRVIHPALGCCGTLDAIVRIEPTTKFAERFCARLGKPDEVVRVIWDGKTREKEGKQLYQDMPVQLAGYRFAELVWLKDNTEVPMPPTDGAAVFQPRPDGYHFEPVVADERTFEAFKALLAAKRWQMLHGAASIRMDSFPDVRRKPTKTVAKALGEAIEQAFAEGDDNILREVSETAAAVAAAKTAPPAKKAAKKATKAVSRTSNATLDSLRRTAPDTGVRKSIDDDQIPF